ncbi:MAG: NIL domain-containing protein [Propionibacteriaceae bacterium]|nr:NIL domain-containing protein [Propionibacteriaceae bacterium]
MTFNLVFVGADAGRATLAQLTADLGLTVRLLAERVTTMEIFPVNVVTVEVDAAGAEQDAAASWFARRGIHRLPAGV